MVAKGFWFDGSRVQCPHSWGNGPITRLPTRKVGIWSYGKSPHQRFVLRAVAAKTIMKINLKQ
eukprot:2360505-Amphidinium_carterae.1